MRFGVIRDGKTLPLHPATAFKKGLQDPIHVKTLEKYNQPLWYFSSEDYTKWAREQYEKERKLIHGLGLAKKK